MKSIAYAVAAALSLGVTGTVTAAQQQGADAVSSSSSVNTSSQYKQSMDHLQRAAQRLRESIQALAKHEPGPQRDEALRLAHKALFDAQQAMIQLPPELRRTAPPLRGGVAPEYAESMKRLQQASDRLYDAMHAMARPLVGERRAEAIRQARVALDQTEEAMLALPNAVGATSTSATGTAGGQGGKGDTKGSPSDTGKAGMAAPAVVLFPPVLVVDDRFSRGCWARLHSEQGFRGETLTLAGAGDFANLTSSAVRITRKWDSIAVGPKATLTTYDNEGYTQPVATFKPGQRTADLDDKLGLFENIRSARLTCAK